MRTEPTWRIPIGILGLLLALALYGIAIATWIAPAIEGWNALLQTLVYLVLGVLWLVPLRRFLIWMETGSIHPPRS
ncbi:MAG: DUF2842 domain-containing protein [Sphingomonadales bacterium CG12_big_fil_rev_8_21_14_0_65_65_10]|uniref:DUF2842 domain-containing protein n=1 Tax=Blastomonas marina TaxID=1867408 RepID=UPI000CC7AF71|nr:DUF2842 domain-containing protein [Blastomonas marina]PIW54814.1 MAG: DUF2842 domain-containing protein [Sphingomonadales bacterium CG12_big_fil_rev_8_21_14_0_65_65_10]WPZ04836.1 DUF2842 domain-containing protein [Blastomonas marina]